MEKRENNLEEPRDRAEALLRLIFICLIIGFAAIITVLLLK